MKVVSGLFDNMVLQRGAGNASHARIAGECTGAGSVVARVRAGRETVRGFAGVRIGKSAGGVFNGVLKGLKCGGPYEISLSVVARNGEVLDALRVRNVLVGDVWVLAGQSNMEGIGWLKHRLKPHRLTRAFYMNDTWDIARDPLHELYKAVDEAHAIVMGGPPGAPAAHIGVGPGTGFAQEMLKLSGVPQGLIACAHGGTSMTQWDPAHKDQGGKSLYGAMLRRIRKNGGSVAGVFWYQGCSDADGYQAPKYTERMKALVGAVRTDVASARLPWVIVQIASACGDASNSRSWDSVQEQQRLLPKVIRNLVTVPAVDLGLDDLIHIAGDECNRLGARAARAMAHLSGRSRSGAPQISFRAARVERDKDSGAANVIVTFDNVVGKLIAPGKPWGFELTGRIGELSAPNVFRIDLDGNRVIVRTILAHADAESMFLYHGLGRRPYCNITDSADRALPALGPIYLAGSRVYAPLINHVRVSRYMPSAGKLHQLEYPSDKAALGMSARQFEGTFCNLHPEIVASDIPDLLVYYAVTVRCPEAMDVEVGLGYDGPVKMWIDGTQAFFDPDGVNPALPEDSSTKVHLEKGEHEVLVALGSNNHKAWGIFLRVARTNMCPDVIAKGAEAYSVPEVSA